MTTLTSPDAAPPRVGPHAPTSGRVTTADADSARSPAVDSARSPAVDSVRSPDGSSAPPTPISVAQTDISDLSALGKGARGRQVGKAGDGPAGGVAAGVGDPAAGVKAVGGVAARVGDATAGVAAVGGVAAQVGDATAGVGAAGGERGGAAVVVRGLRVRIERALIVDGVDLRVERGEWVTVIGPNGAGKSTALRAIGGLLPFAGSVELGGVSVAKLSRRERAKTIASVAQAPVVPPAMRVFDYVLLGRTPYVTALGRESTVDLAAVDDVLGELDLERFAGRRLDTLSGGERQRVFLARALAQGARILLLDEPTSALDIGHQQEVLELVDRLRAERGLTVLATMHDLTTAGEYADRLVLLSAGRVVASGPPAAVLTERNLAEHYRVRVKVIAGEHGPLVVPTRG